MDSLRQIKEIIRDGIAVPDGDNDLRKQQLKELALLNGTLREGDGLSYVTSKIIIIMKRYNNNNNCYFL